MKTETGMNKIHKDLQNNKTKWNQLMKIKNESYVDRQDNIKVSLLNNPKLYNLKNIESKQSDSYDEKSQKTENKNNNVSEFIDIHIAINELVGVATNLNEEFQEYIRNTMRDLGEFHAGPIKTYSRCQAKVQNDYSEETFPRSAKLLDLIRCSLTFDNLSKMMIGYTYFIDFCSSDENSKLIIARIKNGFLESADNTGGYRDIKVNVIYISEKCNRNMICEVQFILRPFLSYKKKAHKLYSINRQKIYFEMASQAYYGKFVMEKNSQQKVGMANIKKVYETKNFEKYGISTGEMHCCISSINGIVASYNASENLIVLNDFKNKKLLTKLIAVQRRSRIFCNGTLFAFVEKKKLNRVKVYSTQLKPTAQSNIKTYACIDITGSHTRAGDYFASKSSKVSDSFNLEILNFNFDQTGKKLIVLIKYNDKFAIVNYCNSVGKWNKTGKQKTLTSIKVTDSCKMTVSSNGDFVTISSGWQYSYFLHVDVRDKQNDSNTKKKNIEAALVKKYKIDEYVGTMASCYYKNEAGDIFLIGAACKKKAPFQSIISVWNINKDEKIIKQIKFTEDEGQIRCLISSGNVLVAAQGIVNKFCKIKVWDLNSWKMFYEQKVDMNIVNYLDLSEDGKYLAISGNGDETLIVLKLS
eukprot:168712_1